jgi:hypothetical protein
VPEGGSAHEAGWVGWRGLRDAWCSPAPGRLAGLSGAGPGRGPPAVPWSAGRCRAVLLVQQA